MANSTTSGRWTVGFASSPCHRNPPKLVRLGRVLASLIGLCAAPAGAQTYGQPYQPGFQPGPYQPTPYQPGPAQPYGTPANPPSIVGTWSGQIDGPNGTGQQADSFSPDGQFVSVVRLPNGLLGRAWGTYRATPVSPNQLRIESQLQGWLPREVCQQPAGGQPQCQPFQVPPTDTSLVTFSSPDQRQTMSETSAGALLNSMRDNQPALLQAQTPLRWVTVVQPSAAPAPIAPSYSPSYRASPTPTRNSCPNDDIQISVCKYSGTLVRSGGCLRCVG